MSDAAFLNHIQCLMQPFTYMVNLFTYIAYIFISLPSFLLPCNKGIVISYSLIFTVAYGFHAHTMKIIRSCLSSQPKSSVDLLIMMFGIWDGADSVYQLVVS